MSNKLVRAKILISGIVQGVGFRYSAYMVAKRLNLRGYVRNLPDGRVEAVVEGSREKVEEFIDWCHRGPPAAVVENVVVEWSEPKGDFSDFNVVI